MGGLGGWLENWRVIPISAFNYVIVKVVAEIGKKPATTEEPQYNWVVTSSYLA